MSEDIPSKNRHPHSDAKKMALQVANAWGLPPETVVLNMPGKPLSGAKTNAAAKARSGAKPGGSKPQGKTAGRSRAQRNRPWTGWH